MDLDKLLKIGEECIHQEPPACTAICPIHMDIIGFIGEIEKGNFKKAYKLMEKKIPFHRIIGQICDHPCEKVCIRNKTGESINISELEKAVLAYGYVKPKKVWPIPKKKEKVAVIGGGLSALTVAMDLDKKGYQVTIFEKTNRIGGRLWDFVGGLLSEKELVEELDSFKQKEIKIEYQNFVNQEILVDFLKTYDAVYLGTGSWEEAITCDSLTFQVDDSSLFIGGQIANGNDSIIQSVSSARFAAMSMDRYISKVAIRDSRDRQGSFETLINQEIRSDKNVKRIEKNEKNYTQEEAIQEAKRCLKCQCKKCVDACSHLKKYETSPDAYIRQINHNERIILGTHYANEMINSCTLCGLCKEECFKDISLKDVIQETRESMVERGKMPLSAHDFALKDMAFSNSKQFSMVRKQPSKEESKDLFYYPLVSFSKYVQGLYKGTGKTDYLFYPGCQLPASFPDDIGEIYQYLVGHVKGDVGIYLGCCGAPADWAGQKQLMDESINKIKKVWEEMEFPTFILACSSCKRVFEKYCPEIQTISLWEIYEKEGLPKIKRIKQSKVLAIHDACGTRENNEIHESVRKIAKNLGYTLEEFEYNKNKTKCCGYGGLVYYANRDQANDFILDRTTETENDILVYCAMCKNLFVSGGKRTYHLLDLIYPKEGQDNGLKKMPSLSDRHHNRSKVKQGLLKEIWNEQQKEEEEPLYPLIISEDIVQKMDDRYILKEDIQQVINNAQESKKRFYNSEDDSFLASLRIDNVTYWVSYDERDGCIFLKNVYSHRMEIVEE